MPVTVARYDGMIHGFFGIFVIVDKSKDAVRETSDALALGLRAATGNDLLKEGTDVPEVEHIAISTRDAEATARFYRQSRNSPPQALTATLRAQTGGKPTSMRVHPLRGAGYFTKLSKSTSSG